MVKKIFMYKTLSILVFWQRVLKYSIVVCLEVSNVYNSYRMRKLFCFVSLFIFFLGGGGGWGQFVE